MPTNVNAPGAAVSGATKKSVAAKLVQAAALTAVLIPLGSVAMEAGPVICGFTGSEGSFDDEFSEGSGCSLGFGASNTFTWFDGGSEIYRFELTFTGLNDSAAFVVSIDDRSMDDEEFAARAGDFPGYRAIPVVDPTGPLAASGAFRDFYVSDSSGAPLVTQWDSYEFFIHWAYDSENNGFPGGGGRARVLHDIGSPNNPNYQANGNAYDEDMCLEYGNCVYDADPGIKSGDTDFQSFTPTVVPEPGTLALLGSGLTGLVYRYRRRRQKV